jgi:hypothetical protein
MFVPMIDIPAVQYIAPLTQQSCDESKTGLKWPERTPCRNDCSVTGPDGRVTYGYWGYLLGYRVCYKCFVPVGPSAITNFPEVLK